MDTPRHQSLNRVHRYSPFVIPSSHWRPAASTAGFGSPATASVLPDVIVHDRVDKLRLAGEIELGSGEGLRCRGTPLGAFRERRLLHGSKNAFVLLLRLPR